MRTIDRSRHVQHGWEAVMPVLLGEPRRWLPRPMDMEGTHEFSGFLRALGSRVRVDYEVFDPWIDGAEVSRRVRVVPRYGLYAGFDGNLVISPKTEHLTLVRFVGRRTPAGSVCARPFGPVTAALLVARFTDDVVAAMDEIAEQSGVSRPDEDPST